jgi:hypothetical protein
MAGRAALSEALGRPVAPEETLQAYYLTPEITPVLLRLCARPDGDRVSAACDVLTDLVWAMSSALARRDAAAVSALDPVLQAAQSGVSAQLPAGCRVAPLVLPSVYHIPKVCP